MSELAAQLNASERRREQAAPGARERVIGDSATVVRAGSRPIMLLIASGIALIAAIAIGTATVVLDLRNRALADSKRELSNIALLVARYTNQEIEELEQVENSIIEQMRPLGIVSSADFERNMSSEGVHQMLKDKISGLSHVAHVIIVDAKGNTINSSIQWPVPVINVADRNYFKIHKLEPQLAWVVSEPIRNHATGTWVVNISRKLVAPDGELLGLIGGAIELAYFEKFFESITLANDAAINMFHRDGTLLARYPHIEPLIGRSFIQSPLFQNIVQRVDSGTIRLEVAIDGQDRLIAAHNLRRYPITIGVATTVAAALAHWQSDAIFMISLGGLAALLIAAMVFVIARQLLRSKKQFQQKIDEQNLQLNTALDNTSLGLIMFDSAARLVVCNDRYRQICKLTPDLLKPGCTFLDILKYRAANGTFSGDPEEYVSSFMAAIAKGKVKNGEIKTDDGRIISIVSQPMAGGGWSPPTRTLPKRGDRMLPSVCCSKTTRCQCGSTTLKACVSLPSTMPLSRITATAASNSWR